MKENKYQVELMESEIILSRLKKEFPEFYREKFKTSDLSDSLIVVDTNYLLETLSKPTEIAMKYLEALEKVKDRIYIPYLVALEFNFNKSGKKKTKQQNIKNFIKNIKEGLEDVDTRIEKFSLLNDPSKEEQFISKYLKITSKHSKDILGQIEDELKELITKEDDKIYNRLISIIENKIGEKYTQEFINNIQEEGEDRYKNNIPPGFNDSSKGDDNSRSYNGIKYLTKFGDLIIWKDILSKADNIKYKKVIFITNDGTSSKKEDLLYKIKGMTVGPHIYLLNELQMECGKELHILDHLSFLKHSISLTEEEVYVVKQSEKEYFESKMIDESFHSIDLERKQVEEKLNELKLERMKLRKMLQNIHTTSRNLDIIDDDYLYKERYLNEEYEKIERQMEYLERNQRILRNKMYRYDEFYPKYVNKLTKNEFEEQAFKEDIYITKLGDVET